MFFYSDTRTVEQEEDVAVVVLSYFENFIYAIIDILATSGFKNVVLVEHNFTKHCYCFRLQKYNLFAV